jgi:hypothetical protein
MNAMGSDDLDGQGKMEMLTPYSDDLGDEDGFNLDARCVLFSALLIKRRRYFQRLAMIVSSMMITTFYDVVEPRMSCTTSSTLQARDACFLQSSAPDAEARVSGV